jgi:isoamylase
MRNRLENKPFQGLSPHGARGTASALAPAMITTRTEEALDHPRVCKRTMALSLRSGLAATIALAALSACSSGAQTASDNATDDAVASTTGFPSAMGARYDTTGTRIRFRVHSPRATHLEVDLYAQASGADEVLRVPMSLEAGSDLWAAIVDATTLTKVGLAKKTVSYGYRAWGPNWTYDPAWTKGSAIGFVSDVDASGNRFDPNKLLLDPFALEVSHDPLEPSMNDDSVYMTARIVTPTREK